jgi:hypothetical protein
LPERDDTFKKILEPHLVVFTIKNLTKLANKLGMDIVHITGYGVERSKMMTEMSPFNNLPTRIFSRVKRVLLRREIKDQTEEELYRYYKFNNEGDGRWWIRAILKNK